MLGELEITMTTTLNFRKALIGRPLMIQSMFKVKEWRLFISGVSY